MLTLIIGIGAAILVYYPALKAPFQFDDYATIVENPVIKSLHNISWLWVYDPSRFLTHLSFALNYHIGGLKVFGYHIVNVIIHLLNAGMVYVFWRWTLEIVRVERAGRKAMGGPSAIFPVGAALVFLLHPIQTQAVTYVSERSVLLATFFYLGTMLSYIQYRHTSKIIFYGLAIGLAALGLFTKPIIISLPFALLLYEIYFLNPITEKSLLQRFVVLWPFFVTVLVVPVLLILWKYKTFDPAHFLEITHETTRLSRIEYLLTQFNVVSTYGWLLLLPIHQNFDYDFPIAHNSFYLSTACGALVIVGIFIVMVKLFKKHRLLSFAILWMFITLALESSIFPINDVIFEHRLYLPMVGFSAGLFLTLNNFIDNPRSQILIIGFILLGYGFLTFRRNMVWQDRIGFMEDVAQKSPYKARVFNNLGIAYYDNGKLESAKAAYRRAIELKPNFANPHNNLGNVLKDQGKFEEAKTEYEEALAIDPNYPGALYNLGNIYQLRADFSRAERFYTTAIQKQPTFVPAIIALGNLYLDQNKMALARFHFLQAGKLDPDNGTIYYSLAHVALKEQNYQEATQLLKKSIKCNPRLIQAYNDLGNLSDMKWKHDEAIAYYHQAITLNPYMADAYFNLAHALVKVKRFIEARDALIKAIAIYKQNKNDKMLNMAQERLKEIEEIIPSMDPTEKHEVN